MVYVYLLCNQIYPVYYGAATKSWYFDGMGKTYLCGLILLVDSFVPVDIRDNSDGLFLFQVTAETFYWM